MENNKISFEERYKIVLEEYRKGMHNLELILRSNNYFLDYGYKYYEKFIETKNLNILVMFSNIIRNEKISKDLKCKFWSVRIYIGKNLMRYNRIFFKRVKNKEEGFKLAQQQYLKIVSDFYKNIIDNHELE